MQQNPDSFGIKEIEDVLRTTQDDFSYDIVQGVNPGKNLAGIVYLLMETYCLFREDVAMILSLKDHKYLAEIDEMAMNSLLREFKNFYFADKEGDK